MNFKLLPRISCSFRRSLSTKVKPEIIAEEQVLDDISQNKYKPRNHLGILKPRVVILPDSLIKSVQCATEDKPIKALVADCSVLVRHLKGRHPPIEHDELKELTNSVKEKVIKKFESKNKDAPDSETRRVQQQNAIKDKINWVLKEKVYNWKPINYDEHCTLLYLFGRLAPEYAVMFKIFAEMSARDPDFKPRSLFDFGSGLGSVTWAATQYWKQHIFEYFNVDSSSHMNDMAELLLKGGRESKKMELRGVFYRQFLPASNTSYDIVVSAYSLLELPSREARLATLLNLWNKTEKYLVLVEQGTNVGFKLINEARDFILASAQDKAHVFSPCPHDKVCPRFAANDSTPCNFEAFYFTMPVGRISEHKRELYSYVVLKKGEINDAKWPRVVRDVLVRSKHSICRMCTKEGNLEEVIFTAAKHGKVMYHCARSTKWGDRLPIRFKNNAIKEEN